MADVQGAGNAGQHSRLVDGTGFGVLDGDGRVVEDEPPGVVAARLEQDIVETQLLRLRNSPRHERFASDVITEFHVTFKDKDIMSLPGEHGGK
jgi:hypothetical protein